MKDDERYFFERIRNECSNHGRPDQHRKKPSLLLPFMMVDDRKTPRDIINEEGFPIPAKRAWYLLAKWADKGWYEYGVTLDLGWITPEGNAAAM